jgi:hypothetical protein
MPSEPGLTICCGSCPFYVTTNEEMGLCHEGPGQVVAMTTPQDALGRSTFSTHTVLPPKKFTDWCGRHPLFSLQHNVLPLDRRLVADAEGTS